jgi:hypothetical protein
MNNKRTIRWIFSLFLALVLFLGWRMVTLQAAEPLDGKTFVGELVRKGEKTGDKDNLIFKDGNFRSTACDPYSFGEGVYTTKSEGDIITFKTETATHKGDKIQWSGTVTGNKLEAIAIWIAVSKKPVEFRFQGELKK